MTLSNGSEQSAAFHAFLKSTYEKKGGSDPLQKSRAKAWNHYLELGLPNRKTEVFRYIKLRHLFSQNYVSPPLVSLSQKDLESHIFPECRQSVLVFFNGEYLPNLSQTSALPDKVVIAPVHEAAKTYGSFMANQLSQSLKDEKDPFAAINAALYEGNVFIYLPPQCAVKPNVQILHLVSQPASNPTILMPRVQIFAGAQSQISIVSSTVVLGKSKYAINQMMELSLEEGAHVHVTQVTSGEEGEGWHLEGLRAHLKKNSSLKTVQVTEGSATTRYDYRVTLAGENAETSLNGVWMLNGKNEAHNHILIEHQAPHCRSNQLFKGILNDVSRSSFEGKILVRQAAQKTEAFQLNNNLLLSDNAHADSKPNLEIFADDVKASHGATVGQLNQEEIFYLTTKGIPQKIARNLLIYGFCKEILDAILVPSLRDKLSLRAQGHLTRG